MTSSRSSARTLRLLATALLFIPALAHAHPGHPGHDGLYDGIAHPLTGLDHLLAMIAVGLWAVQLGGRALWMVPLSFVSLMAAGGALGMGGAHVPMTEQAIVASVFLLGLFLVTARKLPLAASVTITGIFALFHGLAHSAEMPAGASSLAFGVGMILSTVLLHAVGIGAGLTLRSEGQRGWLRIAGAAIIGGSAILVLS